METIFQNNLGDSHQQPSKVQADIMRLNIVRQLIDEEIDAARGQDDLVATDQEVDERLNEMKAPYSQAQFQKRLKSHHTTLDELKRDDSAEPDRREAVQQGDHVQNQDDGRRYHELLQPA